jgi:membrane-associated phospholipid phosphatase
MSIARGTLCIATSLSALVAISAGAQSAPNDSVLARDVSQKQSDSTSTPPWVTKREMIGLGISLVATVAVAPLDKPVAGEMKETDWQKDERLHSVTQALAFAGGPGPFLLGAGLFTGGMISRSPTAYGAGERITESVVLAALLTGLGKGIAGRALPGVKTSEEFEWARGFHHGNGPFVSFPSGHTAAAFAMASALTGEASYWQPGAERYVGPIAYATASAIGLARVYQRVHWMSDLPLAAAIGTWSGLSVESHSHHARHENMIRHIIAATTVQRTADGETLVGWSVPFVAPDR